MTPFPDKNSFTSEATLSVVDALLIPDERQVSPEHDRRAREADLVADHRNGGTTSQRERRHESLARLEPWPAADRLEADPGPRQRLGADEDRGAAVRFAPAEAGPTECPSPTSRTRAARRRRPPPRARRTTAARRARDARRRNRPRRRCCDPGRRCPGRRTPTATRPRCQPGPSGRPRSRRSGTPEQRLSPCVRTGSARRTPPGARAR